MARGDLLLPGYSARKKGKRGKRAAREGHKKGSVRHAERNSTLQSKGYLRRKFRKEIRSSSSKTIGAGREKGWSEEEINRDPPLRFA